MLWDNFQLDYLSYKKSAVTLLASGSLAWKTTLSHKTNKQKKKIHCAGLLLPSPLFATCSVFVKSVVVKVFPQVPFIFILCFLCNTSSTCGSKSMFTSGVSSESSLNSDRSIGSLLLCLGFKERKESTSIPECFSSMYRMKVVFLASLRLHRSRAMRQHNITPITVLKALPVQLVGAQEEK